MHGFPTARHKVRNHSHSQRKTHSPLQYGGYELAYPTNLNDTSPSAARLVVLGLNHQTAPISLRERVAFGDDTSAQRALAALSSLESVREVALLSTCNRTEVYAWSDDEGNAIASWLSDFSGEPLDAYLYQHHEVESVRHLFRVASGLDSLVLGEPQILGQVKTAWGIAREAGTVGPQLDRLFQNAFKAAKKARTDTRIGANSVSVASMAVRMAQETFADLSDSTVLLIGAGETIELAARHLQQANVRRLLIANRTLSHAQTLAAEFGGFALDLQDLPLHLHEADVVISATASRTPVIDADMVRAAIAQRKHRPMMLIDLAVPRDIAPDVAQVKNVFMSTVDDLERSVEENRRSRRDAASAAENIIDLQAQQHMVSTQVATHAQSIRLVRDIATAVRDAEMARAQSLIAAGHDAETVLREMAHRITNRLMHGPTRALRDAAQRNDHTTLRVVGNLFKDNDTDHD